MSSGATILQRFAAGLVGLAAVVCVVGLLLASGLPTPGSPPAASSSTQAERDAEERRQNASDQVLARLGRLESKVRALRAWEVTEPQRAGRAQERARRSGEELLVDAADPNAPNPIRSARELPAVVDLGATPETRGDRVDVILRWTAPPELSGAGHPLAYEIWRYSDFEESHVIASAHEQTRFEDQGLAPGPLAVGYVVFAVTPGDPTSKSASRWVQVDLPELHSIELVEPELAERTAPPPIDPNPPTPPTARPESVRLKVQRLLDRREEIVEVRAGEPVGQAFSSACMLVEATWVERRRPIRYLEPVFLPDGTIEPDGEGARTRVRTVETSVWLPVVELRDGWGRSLLLSPPETPPTER